MKKLNFLLQVVFVLLACSLSVPLYAQANQPALIQAVKRDDPAKARAAIDSGADVNAVYETDIPLCMAIASKRLEIAKLIIQSPRVAVNKRGVRVDGFGNTWERTALHVAAENGHTELVDLLLKKGANINERDSTNGAALSRGNTALILAAAMNHLDTVRLLLAQPKKPDLLLKEREGKTAFWFAVENENPEMVKLLFASGSKINLPDSTGTSVLTTTVLHKNHEVLDYLVSKGADINMGPKGGSTPLMTAVAQNKKHHNVVVKYLEKFLTYKPKLDYLSADQSALHVAAQADFVEALKLLLDHGATINLRSRATGRTPLYIAAMYKNIDAVKYLLKRGASIDLPDKTGNSPLAATVLLAEPEMVEVLVEAGAVVDTRTSANMLMTPLIAAAANIDPFKHKNYMTILEVLLDNKADVNFPASDGRTALMAAAGSSDHGQALEKVKVLINRGAKIDQVNNRGETALMLAAGAGNQKVVELLLDKGADVNKKNGAGESAMSYASRSARKPISAALEAKGAKQDGPIVREKVIVKALIGTWQGYQDGMPQAVFKYVFNKNGAFDFVSRLAPQTLKQFPAGSVNPVIAAQKGTYTFNNDILILDLVGAPPVSMRWKLENRMLILDEKIRLKKI